MSDYKNTNACISWYKAAIRSHRTEIANLEKQIEVLNKHVAGEAVYCKNKSTGETGRVYGDIKWDWSQYDYYIAKIQPKVGAWYMTKGGSLVKCLGVVSKTADRWGMKTSEYCTMDDSEIKCEVQITEVPL